MAAAVDSTTAAAEPLHIRESKPLWKSQGRRSEMIMSDTPAADVIAAAASASASAAAASFSAADAAACAPCDDPAAFVPLVQIDEEQFKEDVTVVALRVPAKLCGQFVAKLKAAPVTAAAIAAAASQSAAAADSAAASSPTWLSVRPRISAVVDGPSKDIKFILLSDAIRTLADVSKLPADVRAMLSEHAAVVTPCLYTFTLNYDYFPQDLVLQRLLPSDVQVPAGFETVGHVAHLNLSDSQLPWGGIIARVLLDKNPHLRTVLSKVGTISSEYRVFDMRVLGGSRCCRTEVREHGCTFAFDFSKVYWNSRLSTEHARMIAAAFQPGVLVVDAMCGIGPFAVPGARELQAQAGGSASKALLPGGVPPVWANDLNPDSFSSLRENLTKNRVGPLVSASNLDGRDFIWSVVRKAQLSPEGKLRGIPIAHVLMNLPAIAVEFLDAFVGLYTEESDESEQGVDAAALAKILAAPLPMVHVYCFSKFVSDPLSDLVPRVERAMGNHAKLPHPRWVKDAAEQQPSSSSSSKKAEKKMKQNKKGGEDAKASTKGAATAESEVVDDAQDKAGDVANGASAAAASVPAAAVAGAPAPSPSLVPSTSLPSVDECYVRFVRNVAPNKDMYCVSFHVPRAVLTATPSWRAQQKQGQPQQSAQMAEEGAEATDPAAQASKRKLSGSEDPEQPAKRSREEESKA